MAIVNSVINPISGTGQATSPIDRADLLLGTAQSDTFLLDSQDTLVGGAGLDFANYRPIFNGESAVITNFSGVELVSFGTTGFSHVKVIADDANTFFHAAINTNEVHAGLGNDTVFSGLNGGVLFGDGGNDVLMSLRKGEFTVYGITSNINIDTFADDYLDGGEGLDSLSGAFGNDTYVVDNIGDVITELANQGNDTVLTTLTSYDLNATNNINLENLSYTGSANFTGLGNALNNVITGNVGNDTLNGGLGADSLIGGFGNDTYVVDNVGDVITELTNQGTDTVVTSLSSYTLGSNLENLSYSGVSSFTAFGNASDNMIRGGSGKDYLVAGGGNNTLDGGLGADVLVGGLGNDTFVIDNVGDIVFEISGNDTIETALTVYSLKGEIENLTYTGNSNFNGSGNARDNLIMAGAGDDTLSGGAGSDELLGGFGADVFTWILADVGSKVASLDKISDFDMFAGSDKLNLKDLLVGELGTASSLDNYLHFNFANGSTTVSINAHGGFADGGAVNGQVVGAIDQQIQFSGVNLTAGFATDAQVIQNLLTQQKLITDIA